MRLRVGAEEIWGAGILGLEGSSLATDFGSFWV